MRRVLTFVVVAVAAASCAQTVDVEKEKAAVMAADADWAKTTTDADKFASYFAADATMDAKSLAAVRMPNRDGFIPDPRPENFPPVSQTEHRN